MTVRASVLGHPRIGQGRELKRALEAYFAGSSSGPELEAIARSLRAAHWRSMHEAGIEQPPSNDFSLYDHVLDAAVLVGAVPERYLAVRDPLARYFAMARGAQDEGVDLEALEMTKWFDTNYHHLVPELEPDQRFVLAPAKILGEVREARALGLATRPVLLGPVTFLLLAKWVAKKGAGRHRLERLPALLAVYAELLQRLAEEGVGWVELDEPCLVLDLDARARDAYRAAFRELAALRRRPKLLVATYFDSAAEHAPLVLEAGSDALHVDLVRAPEQLDAVLAALGPEQCLSVGVIDGRNIWRADLDRAHALVRRAVRRLGAERVLVAPSCSLLHVPMDAALERRLRPEVAEWLAFSRQKLDEVAALARAGEDERPLGTVFVEARAALERRRRSPWTTDAAVRSRLATLGPASLCRSSEFAARRAAQGERLALPLLPTTTVGSFPQTAEVRTARAEHREGRLPESEYRRFLEDQTRRAVEQQEALGLDVLVHGEFERADMVEYFGERLSGFACTDHGWVQSYGPRCVKPPVLYGDVSRPRPMTVEWARYAQGLTQKPVKGMLTGPVTLLKWSFARDDQPLAATCRQLALALRDEVLSLEAAGITVIQVDEPAIREALPLKRAARADYLAWAIDAFRLATAGVRDTTQIHTHMCYGEFGEILEAVARMDADVLSIETARSRMELLTDFGCFRYPNDIGPGVYDTHSSRLPTSAEMRLLLVRALEVLPAERLWVNPDCGLKTRAWPEVKAALAAMIQAAREVRATCRSIPTSR